MRLQRRLERLESRLARRPGFRLWCEREGISPEDAAGAKEYICAFGVTWVEFMLAVHAAREGRPFDENAVTPWGVFLKANRRKDEQEEAP